MIEVKNEYMAIFEAALQAAIASGGRDGERQHQELLNGEEQQAQDDDRRQSDGS